METTKTLRKYVTPSIGVLDIRIERGFGDSFPGGTVCRTTTQRTTVTN